MATRGARPKLAHLRLVDGTHRNARHGKLAEAKEKVEQAAVAFGKLEKPSYPTGRAATAWKELIAPASWLDGSRGAAARSSTLPRSSGEI